MPACPSPQEVLDDFAKELDLVRSAEATGEPTRDERGPFFGMPAEEFREALIASRDELERRAFLVLIAAVEATLQLDFRARATQKKSTALAKAARSRVDRESAGHKPKRIEVEDILDEWRAVQVPKNLVGEFKQLLDHRHWLAHGRYWVSKSGLSVASLTPEFAFARWVKLRDAVRSIDGAFPLG